MDPQKLSQLDPKLRDAYQRVMGTTIPQPLTQPASPTLQRGEPIQTQTPPPPPMPTLDPTPSPTPEPQPEPIPTPPIPKTPVPTPVSEPQSIPTPQPSMPEPPVSEPQPAIPQPQPLTPQPDPVSPVQASNFVQMNSEVAAAPVSPNFSAPAPMPQAQTMTIKKKNGLMPILMGIAIVVFLGIYALFWTKIFNFKLPFLH